MNTWDLEHETKIAWFWSLKEPLLSVVLLPSMVFAKPCAVKAFHLLYSPSLSIHFTVRTVEVQCLPWASPRTVLLNTMQGLLWAANPRSVSRQKPSPVTNLCPHWWFPSLPTCWPAGLSQPCLSFPAGPRRRGLCCVLSWAVCAVPGQPCSEYSPVCAVLLPLLPWACASVSSPWHRALPSAPF